MKAIVSCPHCGHRMRVPADRHIRFNCPTCKSLITARSGRIESHIEPLFAQSQGPANHRTGRPAGQPWHARLRTSRKWQAGLLLVLCITIFAYLFLPSLLEKWAYREVAARPSIEAVQAFVDRYPDSEYTVAAAYLRDSLVYDRVYQCVTANPPEPCGCSPLKALLGSNTTFDRHEIERLYEVCQVNNIQLYRSPDLIAVYHASFPEGRLRDSVRAIEAQLWRDVEDNYAARVDTLAVDRKGEQVIRALLNYAKNTQRYKVYVEFQPVFSLRDWSDYPPAAHELVDVISRAQNAEQNTSYPLPSAAPPPSISEALRTGRHELHQLVVNRLQGQMDDAFGKASLFQLQLREKTSSTPTEQPVIRIDYRVNTLQESFGTGTFPLLYVHLENAGPAIELPEEILAKIAEQQHDPATLERLRQALAQRGLDSGPGTFLSYLLATQIHWQLTFSVPGAAEAYTFTDTSRPAQQISTSGKNANPYATLLSSTFENYTRLFGEQLGLVADRTGK